MSHRFGGDHGATWVWMAPGDTFPSQDKDQLSLLAPWGSPGQVEGSGFSLPWRGQSISRVS